MIYAVTEIFGNIRGFKGRRRIDPHPFKDILYQLPGFFVADILRVMEQKLRKQQFCHHRRGIFFSGKVEHFLKDIVLVDAGKQHFSIGKCLNIFCEKVHPVKRGFSGTVLIAPMSNIWL